MEVEQQAAPAAGAPPPSAPPPPTADLVMLPVGEAHDAELRRLIKVMRNFEQAELADTVREMRSATVDRVARALYIIAKLEYHRKPHVYRKAQHCVALSALVSQLLRAGVLSRDALRDTLDHDCRCVIHPASLDDPPTEEGSKGLLVVKQMLSIAPERDPDNIVAVAVRQMTVLFGLDKGQVIREVLQTAARNLRKPPASASLPGGPSYATPAEPHSTALQATSLPGYASKCLLDFHADAVKAASAALLEDAHNHVGDDSPVPYRLRAPLAHAMVCAKIIKPAEAFQGVADRAARLASWQVYADYARSLIEDPGEILKTRDNFKRPPRPGPWATEASERDILNLEEKIEHGPWHDPNTAPPELHLVLMAVREARWSTAAAYIEKMAEEPPSTKMNDEEAASTKINGLDANAVDIATHPPLAHALISLAFSLMQRALHDEHQTLYPDALAHANAVDQLGGPEEGFARPITDKSQLVDPGDKDGKVLREVLFTLGAHARRSVPLLFGITRLLSGIEVEKCDVARQLLLRVLLPALALTASNSTLAEAIWSLIVDCSYQFRWELYEFLNKEVPKKVLAIAIANARTGYETRSVLKRITVDRYREYQHAMNKMSHGQALSVGASFIRRVQGYPPDRKTLLPFIETLRGATKLAVDMWVFLIVRSLRDDQRKKLKSDGYNYETWFASISLLAGIFLRKFTVPRGTFEGVLDFLDNKIVKDKDAAYTQVLKDVVLCVTEIDVPRSLTTRQQKALAGGKQLRSVVQGKLENVNDKSQVGTIFDKHEESDRKYGSVALRDALMSTKSQFSLACGIARFVSDRKQQVDVSKKTSADMKDRLRGLLFQFVEMMDYLDFVVSSEGKKKRKDTIWEPFKDVTLKDLDKLEIVPEVWFGVIRPILNYPFKTAVLDQWTERENSTVGYSMELAKAFWTLNLPDLTPPKELYEKETARMGRCKIAWDKERDRERRRRRSDARLELKIEEEYNRISKMKEALEHELGDLMERVKFVARKLDKHKDQLESKANGSADLIKIMGDFVDRCIIPRALSSAAGAEYCVRFIFSVIRANKESLEMTELVRIIMQKCKPVLEEATEFDARNLGVLFRELLQIMDDWRGNKQEFEKAEQQGFGKRGIKMTHDMYCQLAFNLHEALTGEICELLKSTEYLHARNALAVLHLVADVFPKVLEHGTTIMEAVKPLQLSDKKDLQLTSKTVYGALVTNAPKRLPPHIFKLKMKKPKPEVAAEKPVAESANGGDKKPSFKPLSEKSKPVSISDSTTAPAVEAKKDEPTPMEVDKPEEKRGLKRDREEPTKEVKDPKKMKPREPAADERNPAPVSQNKPRSVQDRMGHRQELRSARDYPKNSDRDYDDNPDRRVPLRDRMGPRDRNHGRFDRDRERDRDRDGNERRGILNRLQRPQEGDRRGNDDHRSRSGGAGVGRARERDREHDRDRERDMPRPNPLDRALRDDHRADRGYDNGARRRSDNFNGQNGRNQGARGRDMSPDGRRFSEGDRRRYSGGHTNQRRRRPMGGRSTGQHRNER